MPSGRPQMRWPAILDQIDTATLTGLRNFAVLFGIFGTHPPCVGVDRPAMGRSSRNVGGLGGGSITGYKGESEKNRRQHIPTDVWNVVKKILG